MRTRWISALCLGCLLPLCLGQALVADDPAEDDILAIQFLGEADATSNPEARRILVNHLLKDPREEVRFAAVKAITRQLQRGKAPLGYTALHGWRDVPDPLIWDQLGFLLTFSAPEPLEGLLESYRDRRFQQNQERFQHRHDTHRIAPVPGSPAYKQIQAVVTALERITQKKKKVNGLFYEPSARIRYLALIALELTGDIPPTDYDPNVARQPRPRPPRRPEPELPLPPPGRADTANRLNIFDNMSIQPQTRAWLGFQHVVGQNNAIVITQQNAELFSILQTETGRRLFIGYTGFGSGQGNPGGGGGPGDIVNPADPASEDELRDLYLLHNAGQPSAFTRNPNTNLYRAGFEYAVTSDFGVAVQAQYVMPLDDVQQPDMFSNPIIQMKHVLYRDDETVLASLFAVAPQIPTPDFAIVEDTTRLSPGLGVNHKPKEDWFTWAVTGFSFPTDSDQITTWDYSLGLGHWLYRHESLEAWYDGDDSNAFLLGIVPQFDVLGKHIIGSNTVTGLFDLSSSSPQTADGTFNPADGTSNIYLPQYLPTLVPVEQTALFFEEPRHVIDLTMSVTLVFTQKTYFTLGISVPVTGGNSRSLEFLTYINKSF